MYIKWEKPNFNQQVKHIKLTFLPRSLNVILMFTVKPGQVYPPRFHYTVMNLLFER